MKQNDRKSLVRRNIGLPIEVKEGINKKVLVLTDDMAKNLAIDLMEMAWANKKIEINIVHESDFIWLLGKDKKGE